MFEIVERNKVTSRIKVIGIGGGGGNAVNTMIGARLSGVDFMVANTDAQSLEASQAPVRIQLGSMVTKGLGAGANPEIGRRAAPCQSLSSPSLSPSKARSACARRKRGSRSSNRASTR